jgi:hypothetical protein
MPVERVMSNNQEQLKALHPVGGLRGYDADLLARSFEDDVGQFEG